MNIPSLPLASWVDQAIEFLVERYSDGTRLWSATLNEALQAVDAALLWFPPWMFILVLAGLAFLATRRKGLPLFVCLGFGLLANMHLWAATVNTLALVFTATILAVLLGVPMGILLSMSRTLQKFVLPALDIMQTMPAFVYLIPAIPFFGLGKVSAVMATLIFAIPPVVRLTCLGIRQTPPELVECAEAFGSSRLQRLVNLELPLAMPTIVAGINQTVMLALSMAVIAAMIGAGGLGGEVWRAIQRLEIGHGFVAGLGIVIVAVTLDRFFQALSHLLTGRHEHP